MQLKSRHLLGLEGVAKSEIELILDTASGLKEILDRPIPKVPTLRGKTVVNLFFEPSTRTRFSFELAEKRLSADSMNFSAASSSVLKGESLRDTVQNIEAMRINFVVIRHSAVGAPHFLASCIDASVINAGDGAHEHPTQALLDMMTMKERTGRLKDLKVVIVGDIEHSRVARSNIHGLRTMGAQVGVCGPATMIPRNIEDMGITVYPHIEDAMAEADVLNLLRIQLERQGRELLPSLREYRNLFGVTLERLERIGRDLVIMHPGPLNRGVEIDSDVADSEFSVILNQVTNGVAVRMAVLYLLAGGKAKLEGESHG